MPASVVSWFVPWGAHPARLVGRREHGRDRTGCRQWVLWWPRGADVLVLTLTGPVWWDPDSAVLNLRPVWRAVG